VFDQLVSAQPYSLRQARKEEMLVEGLSDLVRHHYEACEPYARIVDKGWGGLRDYKSIADVPFLPVGLFKALDLKSGSGPMAMLKSSGTTGQTPSRVYVDTETSERQSRGLIASFRPILGSSRIPFLVIDTQDVTRATDLTARGAGVLGMMKFGARPAFALNSALDVDKETIETFVRKFGDKPFLIFGFTFLAWTKLYQSYADGELDLSNGILIHSGGWKKLEAERVSHEAFNEALKQRFGLRSIYNFYGFVEQLGSTFIEGEDGYLYPPNFSDVIIRRPGTWELAEVGEEGVIQVVSVLPRSYPGHSVLTEDLGTIMSVDSGVGHRLGKALRISGRVPKAELRGCSDVLGAQNS
jgi:hypothetical protein